MSFSENKNVEFVPNIYIEKALKLTDDSEYLNLENKIKQLIKQKINVSVNIQWVENEYFSKQSQ